MVEAIIGKVTRFSTAGFTFTLTSGGTTELKAVMYPALSTPYLICLGGYSDRSDCELYIIGDDENGLPDFSDLGTQLSLLQPTAYCYDRLGNMWYLTRSNGNYGV